jgi:hypothetical protein
VALGGTRLFVALDARAAVAAAVAGGLGRARLRGFARVPLEPGALVPSPSGASLVRPDEVKDAVRRAAGSAFPAGTRATLVLPDGLARLALLALPSSADPRDFVRFRLATSLPWPAADAVVDVLPVGHGFVIAAAVRRAAVAEHEQALVAAGLEVERVNLAPLLAIASLTRSGRRDAVHVVLGDTAACVVALRGGSVVALRSRRRDPSAGEATRLAAEAERAARLAANGAGASAPALPVAILGTDAERLRRELDGPDALAAGDLGPGEWPEAADVAWLAGVLA